MRMKVVHGPPQYDDEVHRNLAGFLHPEGTYTKNVIFDPTGRWYEIDLGNGFTFETLDAPQTMLFLCGTVHTEYTVVDALGTIILAYSEWPKFLQIKKETPPC